MAGLSTKAIKTRIKSMASTRQITKAMELVASSKLRSAQSRAVGDHIGKLTGIFRNLVLSRTSV